MRDLEYLCPENLDRILHSMQDESPPLSSWRPEPQTNGPAKGYSRFDATSGPQRWKDPDSRGSFANRRSEVWRNPDSHNVERWSNSVPAPGYSTNTATPFAEVQGNGPGRAESMERWDSTPGRGRVVGRGMSYQEYEHSNQEDSWKNRSDGVTSWRSSSLSQEDISSDWRGGGGRWGSGNLGHRSDHWRPGRDHASGFNRPAGGGHRADSFTNDLSHAARVRGRATASPSSSFFRSFGSGVGVGGSIPWGNSKAQRRYSTDQLAKVYRHLLYSGRLRVPQDLEKDDPLLFLGEGEFVDVVEQFAAPDPAIASHVYIDSSTFTGRTGAGHRNDLNAREPDRSHRPATMIVPDVPVMQSNLISQRLVPVDVELTKDKLLPILHGADPGWVYKDPQGMLQGPFSKQDIIEWFEGGFFPLDLMIRSAADPSEAPFRPLAEILILWRAAAAAAVTPGLQTPETVAAVTAAGPPSTMDRQNDVTKALPEDLLAGNLHHQLHVAGGIPSSETIGLQRGAGEHHHQHHHHQQHYYQQQEQLSTMPLVGMGPLLDPTQISQAPPQHMGDGLPQPQQYIAQAGLRQDMQSVVQQNDVRAPVQVHSTSGIVSEDPIVDAASIPVKRSSSSVLLKGTASVGTDVGTGPVESQRPQEVEARGDSVADANENVGHAWAVPASNKPSPPLSEAPREERLSHVAMTPDAVEQEESNLESNAQYIQDSLQSGSQMPSEEAASMPHPHVRPETKPAPWISSSAKMEAAPGSSKSLLEIQKEEIEQRDKERKAAAAARAATVHSARWAGVARVPKAPGSVSLIDIQREEEEAKQAANAVKTGHNDMDAGDKDDALFWDYGGNGHVGKRPQQGKDGSTGNGAAAAVVKPKVGGWAAMASAAAAGSPRHVGPVGLAAAHGKAEASASGGGGSGSGVSIAPPPPPPPPRRPAPSPVKTTVAVASSQVNSIEEDGPKTDAYGGASLLSGQFRSWCADQMEKLAGNRDLTLCEFLMSVESNSEVAEYVATYLGENPSAATFTAEFLKRKLAEKAASSTTGKKSRKARAKANAAAAASASGGESSKRGTGGVQASAMPKDDDPSWASVSSNGKKSKKKGTNQKLDEPGLSNNTAFSVLMR